MKSKIEYAKLTQLPLRQTKEYADFANIHKPRALVVQCSDLLIIRKRLDKDIKLVAAAGFPFTSLDTTLGFVDLFDELDMVIDLAAYYRDNDLEVIEKQIKSTKKIIGNKILKVIIETSFMDDKKKQIPEMVKLVKKSGGDIIKTNTGRFNLQFDKDSKQRTRRRTFEDLLEDVKLIKKHSKLPVKVAGGIDTLEKCEKLLSLKVDYIGTSSNFWIKEENEN